MDLRQIVAELKTERDRLSRAIELLENGSFERIARRVVIPAKTRKGAMTAAGRKRISDAMKRRWAERRRTSGIATKPAASASAKASGKKRGGLTPAGRKRLSEMMKKRWAERRKKTS